MYRLCRHSDSIPIIVNPIYRRWIESGERSEPASTDGGRDHLLPQSALNRVFTNRSRVGSTSGKTLSWFSHADSDSNRFESIHRFRFAALLQNQSQTSDALILTLRSHLHEIDEDSRKPAHYTRRLFRVHLGGQGGHSTPGTIGSRFSRGVYAWWG